MTGKDYDVERRLNDLIARGCLCGLGVMKETDTARSNANTGTTLTADPDFSLPVEANAYCKFAMFLNFEGAGPGTGDFKWQFSSPGNVRYQWLGLNADYGVTHLGSNIMNVNTTGAGNLCAVTIKGSLIVGGSPGNFTFLWAQNMASATSTILHAGSWMEFVRRA